ncbi:MAG: CRISPR-associated helicase Cas3' [Dehalococcoidia bacterium]|nr:CRISPR-associated helicase Cas3' [Dehalococcoidia bacterium]
MTAAFERLGAKFKARDTKSVGPPFHPLACHLADTAAVALELWDTCLAPATRARLAEGLGLDEPNAGRWTAFLAGLHDLGKASAPFQRKYDEAGFRARLEGTGLVVGNDEDPGHGSVTFAAAGRLLEERGVPRVTARRLATLIGAHHGRFVDPKERGDIGEGRPDIRGAWEAARAELFEALAEVVGIDLGQGPLPTGEMPNAAAMALAGFVSVADWIASIDDRGFFDYAPAISREGYAEYFEKTRKRAKDVLTGLRWGAAGEPPVGGDFEAMFGVQPWPVQEAAVELAASLGEGGLVVVEAPMGEGKTEAAFYLVDRWTAGNSRGFYIALPTMATANQMHGRVEHFLKERFADQLELGGDLNIVLAHGGAALMDLPRWPQQVYDEDTKGRDGAVRAGEWFLRGSKRALLAAYGVGTVDQSLMAVLQVKHVFVRLFALAGKPVVIDEVHAYDTYMTGLLERLLEWLGALDAPVVLLSATLPSNRRRQLPEAYARGRGAPLASEGDTEAVAYPRISWLEGNVARSKPFAAAQRSQRDLAIHRLDGDDTAVRHLLVRELAGGGCAAVICNTVASAQRVYQCLLGDFAEDELGLFHARFLAKDRERIENDCVDRFGKPAKGTKHTACRPHRFVLVATQVVEQSLDLDFDVMVSELAPIDLLLQRSGRLQRHKRYRRYQGPAVLHVRWPEGADDPQFDPPSLHVYDEHVLLRTWHALRERDVIAIPNDVQELVDRVYCDLEAIPEDAAGRLLERWRETWGRLEKKRDDEQSEAKVRRIKQPRGVSLPGELLPQALEEDDPTLHPALQAVTRLTKPSAEIVVLKAGSPLIPVDGTKLTRRDVLALRRCSVSVGHGGVVRTLNNIEPPAAFAGSPLLRRHRLVVLDEGGTAEVGPYLLRYDGELGLRLEARP